MADELLLSNEVIDTLVLYNNKGDAEVGGEDLTVSKHGDGSYSFTDREGVVRRVRSHAAKHFDEFYKIAKTTLVPVA
jgi:hypothetical protein